MMSTVRGLWSIVTAFMVLCVGLIVSAVPASAAAPVVHEIQAAVEYDGLPGFDSSTGAGLDDGPNNGVVRMGDTVGYEIEVNVNDDSATNVVAEFVLSGDSAVWTGLPAGCVATGVPVSSVSADGKTLVCNVGDWDEGATIKLSPTARATPGSDGSTFFMDSTAYSDAGAPVTGPQQATEITASYKIDVEVETAYRNYSLVPHPVSGEIGFVQPYYFNVYVETGSEVPSGNMTFTQRLENVAPPGNPVQPPSGAELYTWGTLPECGTMVYNSPAISNEYYHYLHQSTPYRASRHFYGSVADGPSFAPGRSVSDTGTVSCVASTVADGASFFVETDFTISGTDFSLTHIPDSWARTQTAGSPPADRLAVASGYVVYWVPVSDLEETTNKLLRVNHSISSFDPSLSTSGATNYGTGTESDIVNNETDFVYQLPGSWQTFIRDLGDTSTGTGHGRLDNNSSDNDGEGLVVPGEKFTAYIRNLPGADGEDRGDCFVVAQDGVYQYDASEPINTVSYVSGVAALVTPLVVEYTTAALTDSPSGFGDGCDDGVGGWAPMASYVGTGSDITRVRVIHDPAYSATGLDIRLFVPLKVLETAVAGDVVWGGASYTFDQGVTWTMSPNPTTYNGFDDQFSIRATVVSGRMTFDKSVSPSSVEPGDTVIYTMDLDSVGPASWGGGTDPLTITDVLPAGVSFVAGSASLVPDSVTVNGDGTTTVVWVIDDYVVGTPVDFSYEGLVATEIEGLAPFANYSNTASVDFSLLDALAAEGGSGVLEDSATVKWGPSEVLTIDKIVDQPLIYQDQQIDYHVALSNLTPDDVATYDIIEVFPWNGDPRDMPATDFTGTLNYVVGSATTPNGETLLCTNADPASFVDPGFDQVDPNNPIHGGVNTPSAIWSTTCGTDTTALRWLGTNFVSGDPARVLDFSLLTAGNIELDVYTDDVGARSSEPDLRTISGEVWTVVIDPSVDVEKSTNGVDADAPYGPFVAPGDAVVWTYDVTNTGDIPLVNVVVSDSDPAVVVDCGDGTNVIGLLLPGETVSCTADGVAVAGLYSNVVDVAAVPGYPQSWDDCGCDPSDPSTWPADDIVPADYLAPVTDDDPSHYAGVVSGVDIEKSTNAVDADGEPVVLAAGDAVVWTYVVTNTGDTAFVDTVVSDDDPAVVVDCGDGTNVIGLLLPGESATCTADGAAVSGSYTNVALVEAPAALPDIESCGCDLDDPATWPTDPDLYVSSGGGVSLVDEDSSNYVAPGIDVEKATNGEDADEAPGVGVSVGDDIVWSYVVTNVGGTALGSIVVGDSDSSLMVDCGGGVNTIDFLLPGESVTCTSSGVAVDGGYENTGFVSGQPLLLDPLTCGCDLLDPATWPTDIGLYTPSSDGVVTDEDLSHYSTGGLAATGVTSGVIVKWSLVVLLAGAAMLAAERVYRRRKTLNTEV